MNRALYPMNRVKLTKLTIALTNMACYTKSSGRGLAAPPQQDLVARAYVINAVFI